MNSSENQPLTNECMNETNTPLNEQHQEKLYDLTMLEEIAGDNPDFIKSMLQLFIDNTPADLSRMKEAFEQNNWKEVGSIAHKMKSSVSSLGIQSLEAALRRLEMKGEVNEAKETIHLLIQHMDEVLNKVYVQLKQQL